MSSEKLPKTELHAVTRLTLFDIQVCSHASEDDALAWVRNACPSGTTGNWQKQGNPILAPVPCSKGSGRTHYIFSC